MADIEYGVFRTMAEILRTEKVLSKPFREHLAQTIENLSEFVAEIEMTEKVHKTAGKPFYSRALEHALELQRQRDDHPTC